nr:immunoglobulin light chain junction region [Macaca mulatta]
CQQFTSHPLTF